MHRRRWAARHDRHRRKRQERLAGTIMLAAADSTDDPGGGSGGGGGLPITGAPALATAGAGVAALVVGAFLMFLTRRRNPTSK